MIDVYIRKVDVCVSGTERLTTGSSNIFKVRLTFSDEWKGLMKTAIFTNGIKTIAVIDSEWESPSCCVIPHEVLSVGWTSVKIGFVGSDGEKLIIASVMTSLGNVLPGASADGDPTTAPSLPVWDQLRHEMKTGSQTYITLEKHTNDDKQAFLHVVIHGIDMLPADASIHLYRCLRRRGHSHFWSHPQDPKMTEGNGCFGYCLIAGKRLETMDAEIEYPNVPDWMPDEGKLRTEFPIDETVREKGYLRLDLSEYLLPLLKPKLENAETSTPTWETPGFMGIQGKGESNSMLLMFHIVSQGKVIDTHSDTLRIGFNSYADTLDGSVITEKNRINPQVLYTRIQ